jgi:hypothetical protein
MKHNKQKTPMAAAQKSAKAAGTSFDAKHPLDEHGRFMAKKTGA